MADRTISISSSGTEAEAYENEKNHSPTYDSSHVNMKTPEEMEMGEDVEERAGLLPAVMAVAQEKAAEPEKATVRSAVIWMTINTLATIGIVRLLIWEHSMEKLYQVLTP
jgi:solute carrier family 35, member E3